MVAVPRRGALPLDDAINGAEVHCFTLVLDWSAGQGEECGGLYLRRLQYAGSVRDRGRIRKCGDK